MNLTFEPGLETIEGGVGAALQFTALLVNVLNDHPRQLLHCSDSARLVERRVPMSRWKFCCKNT